MYKILHSDQVDRNYVCTILSTQKSIRNVIHHIELLQYFCDACPVSVKSLGVFILLSLLEIVRVWTGNSTRIHDCEILLKYPGFLLKLLLVHVPCVRPFSFRISCFCLLKEVCIKKPLPGHTNTGEMWWSLIISWTLCM